MAPKHAYETIGEYIALFPAEVQVILREIKRVISEAAPGAEEAIRYGIPTFRLKGQNLVHFAAFSNHIGFYPTSSPIPKFTRELSPYKTSKGAIQFPLNSPIPYDLVRAITLFRVGEVTGE